MPAVAEKTDLIAEEADFKDSFGAKIEAMSEGKPIEAKPVVKTAPKVDKEVDKPKAEETDTDPADTPAPDAEPVDDPEESTTDDDASTTAEPGAEDVEEDEPEEDELAEAAKAALTKHGLKLTLDDVPKEYRPIVQAQVANARAATTRALQEARAYRKEEAQYRADRAFDEKHADRRIVELLHNKDGSLNQELYEKVNALMARMETDDGKESFAIINKEQRTQALKAIESEVSAKDQIQTKGDEMVAYVARACTKLDLDFEAVSEAVAAKIALSDKVGLTDQEMDVVIGRYKRHQDKLIAKKKLTQRQSEIKGRTEDKKTTSPAIKAKGGVATPAGAKLPKNDEEFKTQFLAKFGGR